jgi:hypothetical protein
MRIGLDTTEQMLARNEGGAGGIYAPGETIFPSSQAMLLELFADAYLLLRAHGDGPVPMEEAELWKWLAGARRFDAGQFIVVRTETSVATFSYGRQVMGQLVPLRRDLLVTPNDRGLIGVVEDVKNERPRLKRWELIEAVGDFLAVCGELDRGNGALTQRFAFVALPDGRVVYADHVTATPNAANAKPPTFHGGTIGVLNDRDWVHHERAARTLRFADGQHVFAAAKDENLRDVEFAGSPWFNLDDALGIIALRATGRALYQEKPTAARGRREQLFHLSAGAPLPAQSVLVLYPSQTAARTRFTAGKCKLIPGDDPLRFSVALDDGKRLDFDLERLNVESP